MDLRHNPGGNARSRWLVAIGVCLLCWCSATVLWAQDDLKSAKFQKPFFAYLGLRGAALSRLGPQRQEMIEKAIRKAVENGRYIFVAIPENARHIRAFQRKMVAIVSRRSGGLAKMRAEWNAQFQGYLPTARMLRAIRNNSFYYWIEVTDAYAKRAGESIQYIIKANIHISRLSIFDCRPNNRRKSRLHANACRGRSNDEFSGFGKRHKTINASTDGVNSRDRQVAFERSVGDLRQLLVKKVNTVDALRLRVPVMRATFNSVYFALGKAEGLRLSQGFDVYVRHVRGHLINKGYVRVRSIGDNRMKRVGRHMTRVNPKSPLFSTAQPLIGGRLQKGMLLMEHPHNGIFVSVLGGMTPLTHSSFAGTRAPGVIGPNFPLLEGTILIPTVRLGGGLDISNSIGFNEVHLDLMLEIGVGGVNTGDAFIAPILIWIGLTKRFYLRRFSFLVGARVGGGYVANIDAGGLVGADALIGLEVMITPTFQLTLRTGFRAMIPIGSTFSLGPWALIGGVYTF